MSSVNSFRVIQISDTHLGGQGAWFVPNFHAMTRIVSTVHPDLVVNTGDISLDGTLVEDDLACARSCHAELEVPFRAIPGNHDVGDNPWPRDVDPPISPERLTRYRRHFGEDHWLVQAGPWLLGGSPLGLDATITS